jgi:hypothetical protein
MKILPEGRSRGPRVDLSKGVAELEQLEGLPICYANLTSPVTDKAEYINEIKYKIGERLYIENAD